MLKFTATKVDVITEDDVSLGAMWSDHCIKPFTCGFIDHEDDLVVLLGKDGEYRGKTTLDLLLSMGEEC